MIIEEGAASLKGYGAIPIAFQASVRFRVEPGLSAAAEWELVEEAVAPFTKDYDAIPEEGPGTWAGRWDIANWGVLGAFDGERRIGGAVIAWRTAGLDMLRGRDDLAVLWDLRVHPDYRQQGVGTCLFDYAVEWSRRRHCRRLVVETQNINVAACRFYARRGCYLGEVHPFAYAGFPDEVQLLWYRDL